MKMQQRPAQTQNVAQEPLATQKQQQLPHQQQQQERKRLLADGPPNRFLQIDGESREPARRVYARVDSIEPGGPHENESTIYFDSVDADWFEEFGKQPGPIADQLAAEMPLFVLEVVVENARSVDHVVGDWYSVHLDPGQYDQPVNCYGNLFSNPIERTAKFERVTAEMRASLDNAFSLDDVPDASLAQIEATLELGRGASFLNVLDVGQGNAIGLWKQHSGAAMYFDLGGGVLANVSTYPKNTVALCFSQQPAIVLSHWDWDHWSSAFRSPNSSLDCNWLAPRQQLGAGNSVSAGSSGSMPAFPTPKGRLTIWSEKFDDVLRHADLAARRTRGGWLHRRLRIQRHTFAALVLPAALCGFLVMGSPSLGRSILAVLIVLVVGFFLTKQMQWSSAHKSPIVYDLSAQVFAVLAVGAAVWFTSPDDYRPEWPYRHLLIPLAAAMAIALLTGSALLSKLFAWLHAENQYPRYLRRTELFASRGNTAPFSLLATIITALAIAVRAPLALLTLPAMAILMAPPAWIMIVLSAAAGVYIIALLFGGLNDRFASMWLLLQETFFKGGALFVSVLLIALAAARLAGISYITTVFDSAAWDTIGILFAAAYVGSWWFDYWAHRVLTDHILRLLNPEARGMASISYPIDPAASATSVPTDHRRVQIHGSARLLVLRDRDGKLFFQAWSPAELIGLLAASGAPGGKAVPLSQQISSRMAAYLASTGLVFIGIVSIGLWNLSRGLELPEAEVTLASATEGTTLQEVIEKRSAMAKEDPLFIIAASGGGTRAAIYTAAVLEALAQQGKAQNIVLGSGVSGGGAALAYFAGNREDLIRYDAAKWKNYFDDMSKPFIQDVLERSTEWSMSTGGRLGLLLAGSFRERWHLKRHRLDEISDIGLIFNTSLAGSFVRPDKYQKPESGAFMDVERRFRKLTTPNLAGGRLLLTNLNLGDALVSKPLEPDTSTPALPIIIRSPDLTLEAAAALNANFPPVFSNAAIDVNKTIRYWVTDGGVIDNRGMEMMLYAVRLVLAQAKSPLPRLHVIVADASAFSSRFDQDRGISTATGGGSRFASHLDAELVEAIRSLYTTANQADRFQFSYVMMPNILRESGSFGTHWMLQKTIRVRSPEHPRCNIGETPKDNITISGDEMIRVLRALHSTQPVALTSDGNQVLQWALEDQGHQRGWHQVQAALGLVPPAAKACSDPGATTEVSTSGHMSTSFTASP